jgi:glutaredoxin
MRRSRTITFRGKGDRRRIAVVYIFGKDACPYTQAALEDYERRKIPFAYVNVKKSAADLERMLKHSNGRRLVPVIVDGERVTIGFGGT